MGRDKNDHRKDKKRRPRRESGPTAVAILEAVADYLDARALVLDEPDKKVIRAILKGRVIQTQCSYKTVRVLWGGLWRWEARMKFSLSCVSLHLCGRSCGSATRASSWHESKPR